MKRRARLGALPLSVDGNVYARLHIDTRAAIDPAHAARSIAAQLRTLADTIEKECEPWTP